MLRAKLSFFLAVSTLAVLMSACGGGSVIDMGGDGHSRITTVPTSLPRVATEPTVQCTPANEASLMQFSDEPPAGLIENFAAADTPTGFDIADLPALPTGTAQAGRTASATTVIDLENMADNSPTVIYSDDKLHIPSAIDKTAWAIYSVPLPENEDLIGFSITGSYDPAPLPANRTGLWVGLSNYSEDTWTFFGPYTLEFPVSSGNIDTARFGNDAGLMSVLLLTCYGDSVDLESVRTFTEEAIDSPLPEEFYTALSNVGLNPGSLSLREANDYLNFDSATQYSNWAWFWYSYNADPAENFRDLFTALPTYWSGWSGNDEGTDFEPEKYPEYAENKASELAEAGDLQDLLMAGIEELPAFHRTLEQTFTPELNPVNSLANAIADYVTAAGGTPDLAAYETALSGLGEADQAALATVVAAAQSAYEKRDTALTDLGLTTNNGRQQYFDWAHGYWAITSRFIEDTIKTGMTGTDPNSGNYLMRYFPYGSAFFEGGCQLADAIDNLTDYINTNDPTWADVELDIETPAGRITIGGTGDDVYTNRILPIIGKDSTTKTYTVAGDYLAEFPNGTVFSVNWATEDNSIKTVDSASLNAGNTEIVVTEALADDIADGEIRLNGYAVLIDLGGNDSYTCTAGATASGLNGISVCLDISGNDTYAAIDDPLDGNRGDNNNDNTSQYGAGRLGVGILVDYEGTDTYAATRMSEGFAMLGVGAQIDLGKGDDTYDLEAYGQGSAIGGIGLLYDDGAGAGNEYDIWAFGQGCGGVMGIGLLVQHGMENDTYSETIASDAARPEYTSQIDAAYNASFAQGAAYGIPLGSVIPNTSPEEQFVAAGGYGLLFDAGGDDQYSCGFYGQGASHSHGNGILIDAAGSDDYYGYGYTQGAAVLCGLAMLWDAEGDDDHENQVLADFGGANYWSTAWMIDRGGNDFYRASELGLGAGYSNAYGLFVENNGNDVYLPLYADATVETLGRAMLDSQQRDDQRCIGLFVDARGADTYAGAYAGMLLGTDASTVVDTPPDNGAAWTRVGGGWDGGGGYYDLGYGTGLDGQ